MKLLSGVKKRRQVAALDRLEKQLQSGMKSTVDILPDGTKWKCKAILSEKDITRIKKEIQTLKSRI